MGSKKTRREARPAPVSQGRSKGTPWPLIAIAVGAVAGVGIFMAASSDTTPASDATGQTTQATTTPGPSPTSGLDQGASPVRATPLAAEGPNALPMPPLPYVPQMVPRPPELVRQAYVFAAQNPGVLGYVPCYCGCENAGHRSNVDCFVGSRAPNGAVESWDTHGMT